MGLRKRSRPAGARQLARGFEQFEARKLLHAGDVISAFELVDVNPASPTYNQAVSPADFSDHTTLWYFAHST